MPHSASLHCDTLLKHWNHNYFHVGVENAERIIFLDYPPNVGVPGRRDRRSEILMR